MVKVMVRRSVLEKLGDGDDGAYEEGEGTREGKRGSF